MPTGPRALIESIEDSLNHIARCLPRETAIAIWESAARAERLSPESLRRVRWTTPAAHECAASITGLSDSGLETLFVHRLRPWGILIRQQIVLAGRALRSVTRLRWTLAKGYGTPEALRDLNPRTDWDEEDE